MTDDKDALCQRLEELVAKERKEFLEYPKAEALEAVALDLLQQLQTVEAKCAAKDARIVELEALHQTYYNKPYGDLAKSLAASQARCAALEKALGQYAGTISGLRGEP